MPRRLGFRVTVCSPAGPTVATPSSASVPPASGTPGRRSPRGQGRGSRARSQRGPGAVRESSHPSTRSRCCPGDSPRLPSERRGPCSWYSPVLAWIPRWRPEPGGRSARRWGTGGGDACCPRSCATTALAGRAARGLYRRRRPRPFLPPPPPGPPRPAFPPPPPLCGSRPQRLRTAGDFRTPPLPCQTRGRRMPPSREGRGGEGVRVPRKRPPDAPGSRGAAPSPGRAARGSSG